MNSTTQYILACRTLFTLQPDDVLSRDELMRHILKLRQLLQCRVCRSICQDPLGSESCQHLVCYGCLRSKATSHVGCRWCRNVNELKRDKQSDLLIACYRKMCQIVMKSSIASVYRPENGGRNRMWIVIQEANSYNQVTVSDACNEIQNSWTTNVDMVNDNLGLGDTSTRRPTDNASKARFSPLTTVDVAMRPFATNRRGRRHTRTLITPDRPGTAAAESHDKLQPANDFSQKKESVNTVSPRRKRFTASGIVAPIKVKVLRVNDEAQYHVANDSEDCEGSNDCSIPNDNFTEGVHSVHDRKEVSGDLGELKVEQQFMDDLSNTNSSLGGVRNTSPRRAGRGKRRKRKGNPAYGRRNVNSRKVHRNIDKKTDSSLSTFDNRTLSTPSDMPNNLRHCSQVGVHEGQGCMRIFSEPQEEKSGISSSIGTSITQGHNCNGKQESEEEVEILN